MKSWGQVSYAARDRRHGPAEFHSQRSTDGVLTLRQMLWVNTRSLPSSTQCSSSTVHHYSQHPRAEQVPSPDSQWTDGASETLSEQTPLCPISLGITLVLTCSLGNKLVNPMAASESLLKFQTFHEHKNQTWKAERNFSHTRIGTDQK